MKSLIQHPDFPAARQVCEKIQADKHTSWIAGGAVRDGLLGRQPKDIDIATSATPDEVEKMFDKTVPLGKRFGTIQVHWCNVQFEVTTFRKDGGYQDGRHPEGVVFSGPQEDAERRDFTVNALFYDPVLGRVYDFVGGENDLRQKILRAVGDPRLRFQEDHLRILRLYRFQSQLGFQIAQETQSAAEELFPLLKKISVERLWQEMLKLSEGDYGDQFLSHQLIPRILALWSGVTSVQNLSWDYPRVSWAFGFKLKYFVLELLSSKDSGVDLQRLSEWFKLSNEERRSYELLLALQKSSSEEGEWLVRAIDFLASKDKVEQYEGIFKALPYPRAQVQAQRLKEIFEQQGQSPLYKFADLPLGFPREKASEVLKKVHEKQLELLIFEKEKLHPFFEMELKKYV
jgi:tRNA nucleotidyltransferase/poly(A) polymerase